MAGLAATLALGASGCEDFDPPDANGGSSAPGGDAPPSVPDSPSPSVPGTDAGSIPGGEPGEPLPPGEAAAGGGFVFVASPETPGIAVIDTDNLEVRVFDAGQAPRYLNAHPDHEVAVAIDVGAGRAFVVRAGGADEGSRAVDVVRDANRAVVSPGGEFALVYFDATRGGDSSGQELSVVALADTPTAGTVSVGRRPGRVDFDASGDIAFVYTEDGIARIDLQDAVSEGSSLAGPLDFGTDLDLTQVAAPDIELALGFVDSSSVVWAVATDTVGTDSVDLADHPDIPTGFVVTQLAVSGDSRQVWAALSGADGARVLAAGLPELFGSDVDASVSTLAGVQPQQLVAGSVPGTALLLGTREDAPVAYVLREDEPESPVRVALEAAAVDAWLTDFGDALVTHEEGYTLINATAPLAKLQRTEQPPVGVAIGDAGEQAIIALTGEDGQAGQVDVVRFEDLQAERLELFSEPISVGIADDDGAAFVDQHHPDGRLTVIRFGGAQPQTVTGYKIRDRVRE